MRNSLPRLESNTKKGKTFGQILLSYLLTALLPIGIAFGGYLLISRELESYAHQINTYSLKQFQILMDSNLTKNEELLDSIVSDNTVLNFAAAAEVYKSGNGSLGNIQTIQSKLKFYDSISNFSSQILLYFPNSQVAFLNARVYLQQDRLYSQGISISDTDFDMFRQMINHPRTAETYYSNSVTVLPSAAAGNQMTTEDMLIYTRDFYHNGDFIAKALLFTPYANISSLTTSLDFSEGGYLTVLDENGKLLYCKGDSSILDSSPSHFAEGSILTENAAGLKIIITCIQSPKTGWKFVSVLPAATVLEQVNVIRNWVLVGSFLLLLIVVSISYVVSCRHYAPLSLISQMLNSDAEVSYQQIQSSVSSLLQSNSRSYSYLKNDFYKALIHGEDDADDLARLLSDTVHLEEAYTFIGIYINTTVYETAVQKAVSHNFRSLIQQFLSEQWADQVCYLEYNVRKGILLCSSVDPETIERIAASLKNYLENEFHFISFYAACTIPSEQIPKGYQRCESALQYAVQSSAASLVWYSSELRIRTHYFFPAELIPKAVSALMQGNQEAVMQLYETLYQKNILENHLFGSMLSFFLNDLKGNTMKIAYIIADRMDIDLNLYEDTLLKLESSGSVNDVLPVIYEFFILLEKDILEITSKEKLSKFDNAVRYVDEHFTDSQLTLTVMADEFHFSVPYFSSMFKKYTGYNFSNYLEKKRIEYALELLQQKRKIKDISANVGYNSELSFRNAFKRIMGVTPGEYKQKDFTEKR